MKKKLHRLLVFFLLCQLNAAAQTEGYNYEAAIKPVDSRFGLRQDTGNYLNQLNEIVKMWQLSIEAYYAFISRYTGQWSLCFTSGNMSASFKFFLSGSVTVM